jgi:hypothetical protein
VATDLQITNRPGLELEAPFFVRSPSEVERWLECADLATSMAGEGASLGVRMMIARSLYESDIPTGSDSGT